MRFLVLLLLPLASAAFASEPVRLANTATFRISSEEVGDTFFIKVSVPRSYQEGSARYPVLYVTDAESNFGALQYVTQRLAKDKLMPEVIVVGMAYDTTYKEFYRLRERDLRPSIPEGWMPADAEDPTEAAGQNFAGFLRTELIPEIDRRYRTVKGDRGYYGHSYGGLFGTWSLMYEPDLFSRYVVLSPSLWWGELWYGRPRKSHGYRILPARAALDEFTEKDARVFVASGELEPRIDEIQLEWEEAIAGRLDESVRMKTVIYENETHRTIFGRGVMDGLRFVYAEE